VTLGQITVPKSDRLRIQFDRT